MRYNQSGPRLNTMEAQTEIQWTKVVFVSFSTLGHQFVAIWGLECFCAYINNWSLNHPLSESCCFRLMHNYLFQRHMAAGNPPASPYYTVGSVAKLPMKFWTKELATRRLRLSWRAYSTCTPLHQHQKRLTHGSNHPVISCALCNDKDLLTSA